MALRPAYSLGQSEFNDFLFAFVGEEKSGQPLTVLSALARLDLDPWGEAARLSGLTKEAATNALAKMITSLPEGDWKVSDTRSIAIRLVGRLPEHVSPPADPQEGRNTADKIPKLGAQNWLIWIGLAVAILVAAFRLFGD